MTTKKIKKSTFYKNKRIYSTDDIDVNNILVSKKEPYVNKIHLNTLLDIMIMILLLLDHYIEGFHKWLDMLQTLMKMQQFLL